MNEKELRAIQAALAPWIWLRTETLGTVVRELEAHGWSHTPSVLPTPHWRDLPAGPELDEYASKTLYPGEPLVYPGWNGSWTVESAPGVLKAIHKPRSTDLALAMGMLKWPDYVRPIPNEKWELSVGGPAYQLVEGLAQLPYHIVRAKLAAHEAGR